MPKVVATVLKCSINFDGDFKSKSFKFIESSFLIYVWQGYNKVRQFHSDAYFKKLLIEKSSMHKGGTNPFCLVLYKSCWYHIAVRSKWGWNKMRCYVIVLTQISTNCSCYKGTF